MYNFFGRSLFWTETLQGFHKNHMKCPYLVCISKRQPHWIKDGKKYKYVLIYTKAKIKFEIENDHTPYVPVPVIFEKNSQKWCTISKLHFFSEKNLLWNVMVRFCEKSFSDKQNISSNLCPNCPNSWLFVDYWARIW